MAHFLGAELTKELENLNADVNTNDNLKAQQNQEKNTQDNEENGNANDDKTTDDEIIDEEMGDYEGPEWVNVSRIRRYKASIVAENVEGDTFAKKVTNVNKKISHVNDFMGSRIVYIQNKAHVCAVYGKKRAWRKHATSSFLTIMIFN